ncbi:MAG: hemolysin III family protein [Opitutus sp.]
MSVYSVAEERANILTHGFGVVLSVAGLVLLMAASAENGDGWHLLGCGIFGAALVLLYVTSTLYHACRDAEMKQRWRKVDHAGIFLLIAGSYTPFLLVNLRGPWGWSLLAIIWALGLVGMALKFWFAGHFRIFSTLIYVGMGWLVLLVLRPVMAVLPMPGVWLLVIGGLFYTCGTVFYLWKRLPYHHAVWHVFVLAGSVCHWWAVFKYVIPDAATISG